MISLRNLPVTAVSTIEKSKSSPTISSDCICSFFPASTSSLASTNEIETARSEPIDESVSDVLPPNPPLISDTASDDDDATDAILVFSLLICSKLSNLCFTLLHAFDPAMPVFTSSSTKPSAAAAAAFSAPARHLMLNILLLKPADELVCETQNRVHVKGVLLGCTVEDVVNFAFWQARVLPGAGYAICSSILKRCADSWDDVHGDDARALKLAIGTDLAYDFCCVEDYSYHDEFLKLRSKHKRGDEDELLNRKRVVGATLATILAFAVFALNDDINRLPSMRSVFLWALHHTRKSLKRMREMLADESIEQALKRRLESAACVEIRTVERVIVALHARKPYFTRITDQISVACNVAFYSDLPLNDSSSETPPPAPGHDYHHYSVVLKRIARGEGLFKRRRLPPPIAAAAAAPHVTTLKDLPPIHNPRNVQTMHPSNTNASDQNAEFKLPKVPLSCSRISESPGQESLCSTATCSTAVAESPCILQRGGVIGNSNSTSSGSSGGSSGSSGSRKRRRKTETVPSGAKKPITLTWKPVGVLHNR
jgi:hypothetical protein